MKFPEFKFSLSQIGASIVSLGLGLGSGEYILWPFLVATHGFGILWGALLGISIQLFLILELQRYTSVTGEDFISGVSRINRYLPLVLVLCAIVGFGWPGFAASSSALLLDIVKLPSGISSILPLIILISSGAVLIFAKDVYQKMELFQSFIVLFSFIIVLILFVMLFDLPVVVSMLKGLIGIGDSYIFIPNNLNLPLFIGAVAYAGTGGVLILSQSFYTIDEKHGVAKYTSTIKEESRISDIPKLETDKQSIFNFNQLRRFQIFENILFFWALGLITIMMLGYVSHVLLVDTVSLPQGLEFLKLESEMIGNMYGNWLSISFLLIGVFALLSVQIGIYDITARISTYAMEKLNKNIKRNYVYSFSVFIQVLIGVIILSLGFNEPLWLITTGAVINAFTMALIAIFVILTNSTVLQKEYRPHIFILSILGLSVIFYLVLLVINIF